MNIRYVNLFHTSKTSYTIRPPFVTIFRDVLYEGYIKKNLQPMYKYKSRAKWKMLWGIYSAIYGDVNVSVEKCAEIKGDYVEE